MKPADVVDLAQNVLIPKWQAERTRLDLIDRWYHWDPEKVRVPQQADLEEKYLRDLAETPWLTLVVTTVAQQLVAEAVRSTNGRALDAMWLPWQRNRMQSRQRALHRAALAYGYAYTTVLPGLVGTGASATSAAVIRGYSPRDMHAVYQDVVEDEYPMYYLRVRGDHRIVVDEEAVYTLGMEDGKLTFIQTEVHGLGVTPAVRYSNQIDLEGRTPGEVEPFIPIAKRINKTTFDRLLIQHHSSWKVRTATGLEDPKDDSEAEKRKLLLRQNDILTGGEGVQFGTLDETTPDGLIKAGDTDVETLAAVSQTPAHALTGKMINLSADAITEARAMLDLKAGERKVGFGDSHAQTLRLASHVEGREDDAGDFSVIVDWTDYQSRSMAQAADALGKIATMLGVPPEKLWDRIPGVTPDVAAAWLEYKRANPDANQKIADALGGQVGGPNGGGASAH
ncbi:phage portal protein [Curtobacterium sp. MCBD17_003]|uniref:phage portal protein n=1 Tax=Curtobacterium sp. MCBD17_003 TaxID=2175667 RepID=UPI000DA93123|nr:phage portal protein [Curtobacterium sp. MCBD17_003]WIE54221.1 phage portal protein [Curtobacterium sp. MCBD17_003]